MIVGQRGYPVICFDLLLVNGVILTEAESLIYQGREPWSTLFFRRCLDSAGKRRWLKDFELEMCSLDMLFHAEAQLLIYDIRRQYSRALKKTLVRMVVRQMPAGQILPYLGQQSEEEPDPHLLNTIATLRSQCHVEEKQNLPAICIGLLGVLSRPVAEFARLSGVSDQNTYQQLYNMVGFLNLPAEVRKYVYRDCFIVGKIFPYLGQQSADVNTRTISLSQSTIEE